MPPAARHRRCRGARRTGVTRTQKVSLLHELVEHAVGHPGLRADLHALVREIPRDQDGCRWITSSSGPRMKLLDQTSSCSRSSVAG